MNEKRGARASFKLSRKLPFIKKSSLTLSGEADDSKGIKVPKCCNNLKSMHFL